MGALLAALLLFHWFTLRPGHGWGGDFAMYLSHAENLVAGEAYADTGYVMNPYRPRLGPSQYPPGLPVLLSGPMALFGVDFDARPADGLEVLKGWMLVLFTCFLAAVWAFARRRTGMLGGICVLLAVGFNPYLWDIKSALLSEIPFCLFLYGGLYFFDRLETEEGDQPAWGLGILAGLCFYLAYATRTVALVAIPAVLAHDVVRHRRVRFATLALLAVVVPAILLQNQAFDVLSSYGAGVASGLSGSESAGLSLARLQDMLANGWSNLSRVPLYLAWAWGGGLPDSADVLLNVLLFGAGALGFVAVVRERIGVAEVFCVLYVGGISVLPPSYVDLRRLVPVLPLFFLYVVRGLGIHAPARVARARKQIAAVRAALALLLVFAYAGAYGQFERGTLDEGVHTAEANELFEAVRAEVPADGLCMFFKPRVLAHFADVRAAGFWETDAAEELLEQAELLGASHLVAGPGTQPEAPLRNVAEAYAPRLIAVFENELFTLYRLLPETRGAELRVGRANR